MAFTTQHDLVRFDPEQAILYIRVRIYRGLVLVDTDNDVPVRLPVDNSGLVPEGSALTTIVADFVKRAYGPSALGERERVYNIANNGGLVVNRSAIYALTEAGAP